MIKIICDGCLKEIKPGDPCIKVDVLSHVMKPEMDDRAHFHPVCSYRLWSSMSNLFARERAEAREKEQ